MEINTNILHDGFFSLVEAVAHKFYFEVLAKGGVTVAALGDISINISRQGWRHLSLGEKQRSKLELIGRYFALPKIPAALNDPNAEIIYRQVKRVEFWTFVSIVDNVKLKVVVRSRGGGAKHLYSVIWQGEQKKPTDISGTNLNGAVSRLFPRRQGLTASQLQTEYSKFVDDLSRFIGTEIQKIVGSSFK